jgi:hypothetical protein
MRSTVLPSALALTLLAAALAPAGAWADPGQKGERAPARVAHPALSRAHIIPVSEIKPGMEGYGLTVFQGTRVERFHVRVIGILKTFLPKQDVILFRSDDPRLKHSGIVRGMSGSPVYFNGRLAGAVAYGWPYSKDPIGGITPIENMLQVGDRPLRGRDRTPLAQADTEVSRQLLASVFGLGADGRPTSTTPQPLPDRAAPALTGLQRVAVPLSVSGFPTRAMDELRKSFAPFGLEPMQAGGGGQEPGATTKFEPGSAIAVALIRGDMSAVGTGTVTYVEGNRVLAFGHPMFGVGEIYLPVMTARIHTFMPSVAASFKMSSPMAEAGTLVMDRQAAIAADTGRRVDMIPVDVTIRAEGQRPRSFHAEVARHKFLTPMLTGAVLMSAGMEAAPDIATATVRIRSQLKIKGHEAIPFVDRIFTANGMSPRVLAFSGAFRALQQILFNPFEPAQLERLTFDVEISYRADAAEMVGIRVDDLEVDPGQKVNLYVTMRPYQGAEYVETIPFVIPKEYAGQNLFVEVVSGPFARVPMPTPESLAGILENLRRPHYPADVFVITMMKHGAGVAYRGRLMPELPPSAIDTLRQTTSLRRVDSIRSVTHIVRPAGRVVVGRQRITFKVKDLP